MIITMNGGALPARSSRRRWSAYCDLQPQLRGQAARKIALVAGDRVVVGYRAANPPGSGRPCDLPAGAVGLAERDLTLGPQAAGPDQAVLPAVRRRGRGDTGQPSVRVRASCASRQRCDASHKSLTADAATASGRPAAGQR